MGVGIAGGRGRDGCGRWPMGARRRVRRRAERGGREGGGESGSRPIAGQGTEKVGGSARVAANQISVVVRGEGGAGSLLTPITSEGHGDGAGLKW